MAGSSSPLNEALARLYQRQNLGIKLGLEFVSALLEELGRPHQAFRSIHVAGTNGKGSVCALVESVLRQAGVDGGLYTSPHLVRFNERIRVGGAAIGDGEIAELMERIDRCDEAGAARPGGRPATFFEYTTALAFEHFKRNGVAWAVLETGLGGRLDATNVVDPAVTVITRIGLEHTQILGRTLEQIAGEKVGIIKPGRPVVCGVGEGPAREIVLRAARERGAPVVLVEEAITVTRLGQDLKGQKIRVDTGNAVYGPFRLPLIGPHQLENAAAAVAALDLLQQRGEVDLTPEAVRAGFESVQWPARCQLIDENPPVLLDAAHNPDGARMLAATVKEVWPRRPVALVAGLSADKDAEGFFRALAPRIDRLWATQASVERAMPVERVVQAAQASGLSAERGELAACYQQARQWAGGNQALVLVAGSLYLAGELLDGLGRAPA